MPDWMTLPILQMVSERSKNVKQIMSRSKSYMAVFMFIYRYIKDLKGVLLKDRRADSGDLANARDSLTSNLKTHSNFTHMNCLIQ